MILSTYLKQLICHQDDSVVCLIPGGWGWGVWGGVFGGGSGRGMREKRIRESLLRHSPSTFPPPPPTTAAQF